MLYYDICNSADFADVIETDIQTSVYLNLVWLEFFSLFLSHFNL